MAASCDVCRLRCACHLSVVNRNRQPPLIVFRRADAFRFVAMPPQRSPNGCRIQSDPAGSVMPGHVAVQDAAAIVADDEEAHGNGEENHRVDGFPIVPTKNSVQARRETLTVHRVVRASGS